MFGEEEQYEGITIKTDPYWEKQQEAIRQRKSLLPKRLRTKRILKYQHKPKDSIRGILNSNLTTTFQSNEAMSLQPQQFQPPQFSIFENDKSIPEIYQEHNEQILLQFPIFNARNLVDDQELSEQNRQAKVSQIVDRYFYQMREYDVPQPSMEVENDWETNLDAASSHFSEIILKNDNYRKNGIIKNERESNGSQQNQNSSKASQVCTCKKSQRNYMIAKSDQGAKDKQINWPQFSDPSAENIVSPANSGIQRKIDNTFKPQPETRQNSSSCNYLGSPIQFAQRRKQYVPGGQIQYQCLQPQVSSKSRNNNELMICEEKASESGDFHPKGQIFPYNKNATNSDNQLSMSFSQKYKSSNDRSRRSQAKGKGIKLAYTFLFQQDKYQRQHFPQPKQKSPPKQLHPPLYHAICTCRNCQCDSFHCNCRRRNKKCNQQCNCNSMICRNYHPVSRVTLKMDQKPSQMIGSFSGSAESAKSMTFDLPNFSLN